MMLVQSGSIVTSGWPMLLLLLLPLMGGGVIEFPKERGQIMDKLPVKHRDRLELVSAVLALDDEWSAVWSEKLKSKVVSAAKLDPAFCSSLQDIGEPVDPLETIKRINQHCSYSGMYMEFATNILAHSVKCFFYRYARLQLQTVPKMVGSPDLKEYVDYLESVVYDYQLIADRLATVGAELNHLIALAKFYIDITKQSIKFTKTTTVVDGETAEKYKRRVVKLATDLDDKLENEMQQYCAVTETSWYYRDADEVVGLNLEQHEIEIQDNSSTSDSPTDDPKNQFLKKAYYLQMILRNVFERLHLGKMPPEVWKLIFEKNILAKPIEANELQAFETRKDTLSATEISAIDFDGF